MGTGSLFIGFLFLINPDYLTLDIFPDLIGYLLIARGLYRLSFLEERIGNARRYSLYLAFIGLLKIFSNAIVLTTSVESTKLSVLFLFAVSEGFLAYLLADNLFKGVQYLSVRMDSDLALKGMDVCQSFVKVFLLAKSALSFLPSSLILFFPNVDADPALVEGYGAMRRTYLTAQLVVTIICGVSLFAFGIYTTRIVRAYEKRIKSDSAFIDRLSTRYREKVSENQDAVVRIHVRESFFFFFLAALFIPDLYMDQVNLLPSFLAVTLVWLGLRNLSKGIPIPAKTRGVVIPAFFITFGAAVLRTVCQIIWAEKFMTRFSSFLPGLIAGILCEASLFLIAVVVIRTVWRVCRLETEVRYRLYGSVLAVLWLIVCAAGVVSFSFPGLSGVVQAGQIALALTALYLHKKKMDDIRAEVEWHRM